MRISGKQVRDAVANDASPSLSADLDVGTSSITTTASNGNVKLEPKGTGAIEIRGADGNDGVLQLNCSNNSHGVKLQSPPHSAAASYTLTLPNDDGDANQVLKTDGSGVLSWVAQSGGPADTDSLSEGTSNLYFTNARADARVAEARSTVHSESSATSLTIGGGSGSNAAIGSSELERVYIISTSSGDVTVTLPSAVGLEGFKLQLKSDTSNTVKINTVSSQKIDGTDYSTSTLDISTQYNSYTIVSDNSNWYII